MEWEQAKNICRKWGGDLFSAPTPHDQAWLITLTAPFKGNAYWIGLNELGVEGKWQWSDGSPTSYFNWDKGQPYNKRKDNKDEDCAAAWFGKRKWHDMVCYAKLPYICKRSQYFKPQASNQWDCHEGYAKPFVNRKKRSSDVTSQQVGFKVFSEPKSWSKAKDTCEQWGGGLALIHSKEEQAEI